VEFIADEKVKMIAEAYTLDAIDFGRTAFSAQLDRSDASIAELERILTKLHDELPTAKPTDEVVDGFVKMLGSYLGEVLRMNHGATWGMVNSDGASFPGMQAANGELFWPWGRVRSRLENGPEDDVESYCKVLFPKFGQGTPPSFWSRWFGARR
jgi:hypothetical protein